MTTRVLVSVVDGGYTLKLNVLDKSPQGYWLPSASYELKAGECKDVYLWDTRKIEVEELPLAKPQS